METARKILSLNMAERSVEQTNNATAQALLLDFVGSSQTLRLWSINRNMMENLHGSRVQEHMQKGKVIDEWWKQVMKGASWFCLQLSKLNHLRFVKWNSYIDDGCFCCESLMIWSFCMWCHLFLYINLLILMQENGC